MRTTLGKTISDGLERRSGNFVGRGMLGPRHRASVIEQCLMARLHRTQMAPNMDHRNGGKSSRRGATIHFGSSALCNAEYPPLHLCHLSLFFRERRIEVPTQQPTNICLHQPASDGIGVLLVRRSIRAWIAVLEDRWVDFGNYRFCARYVPTIKRPEMHVVVGFLANVPELWNPGVRRLGNAALDIEPKN